MDRIPDISIIIPFLNEEDNIGFLSEELSNFVCRQKDIEFEIILVNDGSTDRSVEKISKSDLPGQDKADFPFTELWFTCCIAFRRNACQWKVYYVYLR